MGEKSAAANQQIDICKHSRNKLLCMQRSRVRNLKWVFHCKPWVKRGRWAWCVSVFFSLCRTTVGMLPNERMSEPRVRLSFDSWQSPKNGDALCHQPSARVNFEEFEFSETINSFLWAMLNVIFRFFFLVPAFFHVDFVFPTSLLQHFLKNLPLFALFQRSNTNEYGSMVQQKDENLSRQT